MKISQKLVCPSCRGLRLVLGNREVGANNFVPVGKVMVVGFKTYRMACLDCGYIGTCLGEAERCDLERKVRDA
jgi:hypothetical protein